MQTVASKWSGISRTKPLVGDIFYLNHFHSFHFYYPNHPQCMRYVSQVVIVGTITLVPRGPDEVILYPFQGQMPVNGTTCTAQVFEWVAAIAYRYNRSSVTYWHRPWNKLQKQWSVVITRCYITLYCIHHRSDRAKHQSRFATIFECTGVTLADTGSGRWKC